MKDASDEEKVRWKLIELSDKRIYGEAARFWMIVEHFQGESRRKGKRFSKRDFSIELTKLADLCEVIAKELDATE